MNRFLFFAFCASSLTAAEVIPVTVQPATVQQAAVQPQAVQLPEFRTPQISTPVLKRTAIPDLQERLDRYADQAREIKRMLVDQRSLAADPSLSAADAVTWKAWRRIFTDPAYQNYRMKFKQLAGELRIISELRAPQNDKELHCLITRLNGYRRWGYNAVLVCFDTTENLRELASAVDTARMLGFRTVIVYTGGREKLTAPIFRDPEQIRRFLVTLAPRADALLLGWWRTSVHLYLPDQAFTNFLVRTARSAAPDLPVIGQAYWGHSAATLNEQGEYQRATTIALPENSSAVLVMGMGYPSTADRDTLTRLFPEVAEHPHKIALVAGERPYFDTRNPNGRSALENAKIKRSIELRLLRAGFSSTLTFSGDGSNGIFDPFKTENLCKEYPEGGTK